MNAAKFTGGVILFVAGCLVGLFVLFGGSALVLSSMLSGGSINNNAEGIIVLCILLWATLGIMGIYYIAASFSIPVTFQGKLQHEPTARLKVPRVKQYRCPSCGSPIEYSVTTCGNCSSEIVWQDT